MNKFGMNDFHTNESFILLISKLNCKKIRQNIFRYRFYSPHRFYSFHGNNYQFESVMTCTRYRLQCTKNSTFDRTNDVTFD